MFVKLMNLHPQKRDALLNAALKEFVSKGYENASTNTIAKEAGVSKALMFHYVHNKKDFYLFLHQYCSEIVNREYYQSIHLEEKDLFKRLRQSYQLQLEILRKYPWILEFLTTAVADGMDAPGKNANCSKTQEECFGAMFEGIDVSLFRDGLDMEKCKRLISWACNGATNELLEKIRHSEKEAVDFSKIMDEMDSYLDELKKSFYR